MDIKLSDYTPCLNKKAMYMLLFSYFEVFFIKPFWFNAYLYKINI